MYVCVRENKIILQTSKQKLVEFVFLNTTSGSNDVHRSEVLCFKFHEN